MEDVVGIPFEVGQVITYPGRYSSTLFMRVGVVREVLDGGLAVEVFEVCFASPRGYYVRSYRTSIYQTRRATVSPLNQDDLMQTLQVEADAKTVQWQVRQAARQAR
jgi:hypothetical protein